MQNTTAIKDYNPPMPEPHFEDAPVSYSGTVYTQGKRETPWSMAEILETEFPEPRWAVPGLIPIGLTLIAGRPKVGKSWLGLQLAHSKGTGGIFLGVKVEPGSVLYLALEDSPRRLQTRSRKQGIPRTAAITFYTAWKAFHKGGLDDLLIELEANNYSLVVIDTLERATPGTDKSDEKIMGPIFDQLQRMAQNRNMAIVLLDHHRKNGGFGTNNPIDDVIGTTAKAGTADAIAGMYKEPGKRELTFTILGRDVEEQSLSLRWDPEFYCWQCLGASGEVRAEGVKADILEAIADLIAMGEYPTTTRIGKHIGKDLGQTSRAISELLRDGKILQDSKHGREQPYKLPAKF